MSLSVCQWMNTFYANLSTSFSSEAKILLVFSDIYLFSAPEWWIPYPMLVCAFSSAFLWGLSWAPWKPCFKRERISEQKIRSEVNSYIFQMVVHFARHVMGSIVFHREVLLVIFASWWILHWTLKRLSSVCSFLYAAVEREWHSPLDSR